MESLSSDPVIMAGNAPVGGGGGFGDGFGGGGLLAALGLAGIFGGGFGNNRYQGPALVEMSALLNEKAIGDTRRDVADSTSEIRESLHNQSMHNSGEFRNLDNRINDVGVEALRGKYDSIIAQMVSTNQLDNKVERETRRLSGENREIQTSMDRQFDRLERRIQDGFNDVEKREMQNEIDRLRRLCPTTTVAVASPCGGSASTACDPALLALLREVIAVGGIKKV